MACRRQGVGLAAIQVQQPNLLIVKAVPENQLGAVGGNLWAEDFAAIEIMIDPGSAAAVGVHAP